jgi:hypothetical protein
MKIRTVMATSCFWWCSAAAITLENYNSITVGMSYDEVIQLIGPPEKCDDVMGVRNCLWGNENGAINVSFVADKVLLFSSSNLKRRRRRGRVPRFRSHAPAGRARALGARWLRRKGCCFTSLPLLSR